MSGKKAWAILATGVAVYELTCSEDQLLSVIVDEWLETHPIATRLAISTVALHLLNILPWYIDPLGKRVWKTMFS